MIEFDEQGQMRGVTKAERTWANRLIEEFMLAANECVATWLEDLGVPSLYRIHEKPEPRRVVQFEELAASFGYSLGLGAAGQAHSDSRRPARRAAQRAQSARTHEVAEDIPVTPKMYQKLAARIEGKPEERILSYLMLRSLKQARYSEINEGHFALAAPTLYAFHFADPPLSGFDCASHHEGAAAGGVSRPQGAGCRRDVTVRRGRTPTKVWRACVGFQARNEMAWRESRNSIVLAQDDNHGEPPIPEAELAQIAEETSQTERRAAEAERELGGVEEGALHAGQRRRGVCRAGANPAKYGLFVELTDLFVEGLGAH